MSGLPTSDAETPNGGAHAGLFFRRWLANPLQMGSVIPSSPSLCRRIAALVERTEDEVVVELGAGTGAVHHALLAAGVPVERLVMVEIVPAMAEHLRQALPWRRLGLSARREAWTARNVPPASVWRYRPAWG